LINVRAVPAADIQTIEMQLGWIGGGNQLGEVAAQLLGYHAEEHLELKIVPGGPNNDGVAGVASGRSAVGQVSSSPSLMLAVSQDLPIRCFAVPAQKHPYAFFSLAKSPVRHAGRSAREESRYPGDGGSPAACIAGEERH
jgi:NitT/TauT family transport system substrate-binding protein